MSQGFVYAIADQSGDKLKIGYSKNPNRRLKQLATGSSDRLYILTMFHGDKFLEKLIHRKFKKVRHNGEWMKVSQELLDYINNKSEYNYTELDDKGKLRSYLKIKM